MAKALSLSTNSNDKKRHYHQKQELPFCTQSELNYCLPNKDKSSNHWSQSQKHLTVAATFYAWFLQPSSACQLVQVAQKFFSSITMTTGSQGNSGDALYPSIHNNGSLLHVTAKFCGKGGGKEYAGRPEVAGSIGQQFNIQLTGLLLKPGSSLVARAELTPEQLVLWDNEPTGATRMPQLPRGSRAHVTLATAPDIRPVQAGFDLLEALASLASLPSPSNNRGSVSRLSGDGFYLTLAEPLTVATMFKAQC